MLRLGARSAELTRARAARAPAEGDGGVVWRAEELVHADLRLEVRGLAAAWRCLEAFDLRRERTLPRALRLPLEALAPGGAHLLQLLLRGLLFILIPIPVIRYFLFDKKIISCKIPQIFFFSIKRSFGFL